MNAQAGMPLRGALAPGGALQDHPRGPHHSPAAGHPTRLFLRNHQGKEVLLQKTSIPVFRSATESVCQTPKKRAPRP